ncbi:MAG TPA: amidohydrolase [Thermoplasmata archaeon]|nr:amidohydrolase [Thermoplasmata archaeon]
MTPGRVDDALLLDARVLTPEHRAEALLVEGGEVVAVGPSRPVRRLKATGTPVYRLRGRLVLPGFIDAHMHYADSVWADQGVPLRGVRSLPSLGARLRRYLEGHPNGPVVGGGWDETWLREHRYPTAADLDRWVPHLPTLLYRTCTHVAVLNTAAMEFLHIDASTEEPPGGSFLRDAEGAPNGVLVENAERRALPLVERFLRAHEDAAGRLFQRAASEGVTQVGAMSVEPYEWESLARLARRKRLPVEVSAWANLHARNEIPRLRRMGPVPGVKLAGVKAVLDGALGPRTAWLRSSYSDAPRTAGRPLWTEQALEGAVADDRVADYPIALHAIGDRTLARAIRLLRRRTPGRGDRIEHASVVPPHLIPPLRRLRATIVVQPQFIRSDSWLVDRLGPSRAPWAYPLRTLRESGLIVAGSSDAPVEALSPLAGMRDAVRRVPGTVFGRMTRAEALRPEEALSMYTRDAARAIGSPQGGQLVPGEPADFVVIKARGLGAALRSPTGSVQATFRHGACTFGGLALAPGWKR